uniref:Glutaredoxin n=1 Tax=Arcella intermedia TaxID=1963864 RepID=A0A6B2LQG0_9EUKA
MYRSFSSAPGNGQPEKPEIFKKIDQQIKSDKCVVYMKGNADEPRCGYSRAVVQVLRMNGAQFKTYDVLSDEPLRNAMKEYSNWPTYPQVYLNGEFVGGCDILLSLQKDGALPNMLKEAGALAEE